MEPVRKMVVTKADFEAHFGLNPDKFTIGARIYPANVEYIFATAEEEIKALEFIYQLESD